jgi:hypothetical protein
MKHLKVILIYSTIVLGMITLLLPSGKEYSTLDLIRTSTGVACICCLFGTILVVLDEAKKESDNMLDEEYED